MQTNTDEIPIDDPDELAVEEEFKKLISSPIENDVNENPVTKPPVPKKETLPVKENRGVSPEKKQVQSRPQSVPTVPQVSLPPATPLPPVVSKTKQNTPPRSSQPPVDYPTQSPTPPHQPQTSDINQLQSLAKSKGLKTSMDNIGSSGDMLFDIEVMESGDDGRPMVHVERGVSASSERELRQLYAMSDQKINIIRAYGGGASSPPPMPSSPSPPPQTMPQAPVVAVAAPVLQPVVEQPKEPPKYFNVSGVECKLENGKVYQRQWVRLAGADAESFRLVNDANNKIVPIDGKHIEQKKWVLIQDNAEEGN